MVSWGLIAGLTLLDMQGLQPGFVMDAFVYRQKYDGEMRGIISEVN